MWRGKKVDSAENSFSSLFFHSLLLRTSFFLPSPRLLRKLARATISLARIHTHVYVTYSYSYTCRRLSLSSLSFVHVKFLLPRFFSSPLFQPKTRAFPPFTRHTRRRRPATYIILDRTAAGGEAVKLCGGKKKS